MSGTLPLPNCDVIVVGDLTGGSVQDSGRQIAVDAVLRAQRVVKGSLEPGSEVRVAWDYMPNPIEGPARISTVPMVHALWLLSATGKPGEFRAVQLSRSNALRYYLPFPEGDLPADFSYSANDTAESKLSRELGFALETQAARDGSRLNVTRVRDQRGLFTIQANMQVFQFTSTADLFWRVPPKAAVPVLRRFATSPLPNLRIVGINGLIRLGDQSALIALERGFAELIPTSEATHTYMALTEMPIGLTPEALNALGRIVLSETELPNVERPAADLLGLSGQVEALPYLAAMLESPSESTRSAALWAFCTALRPNSMRPNTLEKFWTPETAAHCPSGAAQLPDAGQVSFWQGWWQARRKDPPVFSVLPAVALPARYRN